MEDTKDTKVSPELEQASGTKPDGEENNLSNKSWTGLDRFRHNKYFLFVVALFIIIIFSVVTLVFSNIYDQQRILEGVTISGVDVGGLTQDQAKTSIDKEANRLRSQTLKLNVGQQSVEVKLEDLGFGVNGDLVLQEAYDIGRKGSFFEKLAAKKATAKGVNINLSPTWDEPKLRETLKGTLGKFDDPATDATFQVTINNTMDIKSEHVGLVVDTDSLIIKIKELNIYKLVPELKVELKEQVPLLTAAQLEDQKITGLLASYTTKFDPTQTARTENVKIAAKALDTAIIKPGATLSFNQIVGERTIEGGYKDAYIIVNGEFVPGLAGGICQVSSTLYNTGLLANLAVIQRSNHDLAISYVPLGQDATVAYPDIDLKFNNNSAGYLLVRTKSDYNSLTIEMYGQVKPSQDVIISNTIQSTIPAVEQKVVDKTIASGGSVLKQQGQPGYHVKSTRTVKVNGATVSSEQLNPSSYLALPRIYAVGP